MQRKSPTSQKHENVNYRNPVKNQIDGLDLSVQCKIRSKSCKVEHIIGETDRQLNDELEKMQQI